MMLMLPCCYYAAILPPCWRLPAHACYLFVMLDGLLRYSRCAMFAAMFIIHSNIEYATSTKMFAARAWLLRVELLMPAFRYFLMFHYADMMLPRLLMLIFFAFRCFFFRCFRLFHASRVAT